MNCKKIFINGSVDLKNKILAGICVCIYAISLCGCSESESSNSVIENKIHVNFTEANANKADDIYEKDVNYASNDNIEILIETYMKALSNDVDAIIMLIGDDRFQDMLEEFDLTKERFYNEYPSVYAQAVSDGLIEDDEELKQLFLNYEIVSTEKTDESISYKDFDNTYEVVIKVGDDEESLYIGENNGKFYFDDDVEDDIYSDLIFIIENYMREN